MQSCVDSTFLHIWWQICLWLLGLFFILLKFYKVRTLDFNIFDFESHVKGQVKSQAADRQQRYKFIVCLTELSHLKCKFDIAQSKDISSIRQLYEL